MANGKVVGIVKSIIGTVQVIDKNGSIRTLEVGGYLYEGEKVISDDAKALLQIKYLEFPDIKNYTGVFTILVDNSVARVANEDVNSINKNDLANMTETEAGQENSSEHFLPSSFQSVAAQNVFEIDRGKKTAFGDGIIDSGKRSKMLYDGGDQSPPVFLSNNVVIYNEESDEDIIDINTSDMSSVSFSIEEGLDSSLFSIESTTGVLQFTFIPDFENPQDDNGDNEYNVAVTATDVYGNYTTQMLSIFINNINDNRPESLSESFVSIEDTIELISGQLYGKDADGNSFTYVLVENVAEGELTFSSDGQYVFSVGEDFQDLGLGETRAVTFTYKTLEILTPEGFESDIATITITVTGTNDIPFAQIDERVTTENTNIVIDVLANDTDIDTTATFTLDNVSVAVGQGSVSIVENQLVFNLENDFDYLAVGESTQVSISYEMSDEQGAKSSSIVLVTVVGRNDQPVVYGVNMNESPEIIPLVEKMFYETDGIETVYVGQLKVFDLDVTDTHVFQLIENSVNVVTNSGVSVENLKVVVNGDGVFEIIGNFDHLSDNETATVTFQYVAIDDSGVGTGDVLNQQETSAPKSVTLTMTGTNDQPIVSDVVIMDLILERDNIQTVYQGELFLREDLDSTDTHTFQLVSGSQSVQTSGAVIDNFSVMLNLDGHYEVSGNFDHLSESETALIEFKYTAMDDSNTENAVSQEKRVQLTVTGMNDRPVVSDVTILDTLNATDGYETIYKGVLNVKDIDTSDTHIFKLVNNTLQVVTTSGVVLDNIDVSVDENGAYKVNGNLDALNNNESATIFFQYLAIDNSQTDSSTSEAKTVRLTVNGKDNVTTINESTVANGKTIEDSIETVTGKIDASDLDTTDNDLTYTLNATQGVYGEISIDMLSGVWAYIVDNTRNVTQALEKDQQVRESFIVTVATKQGETVSQTITIDLVGTNDTPMIATVLAVETKEDAAVIYGKLIANDIDQNAVLTYSAAAVAGFMLNGQTGEYSFDPSNENYQYLNAGDSLTVTIPVSVTDEHGAKA
ncbi:VCBS domain-containing protein, partial [Sulfuricurvum sp.]|uniref:VCBS domain-containing protein n=1 Tax=Sulfuricurvum sp. TaxID=2025608 RepID=UPI0026263C0E